MKECFLHGVQEGTSPLVLPYGESSYPVLLNRTRALTTWPKLDLCTSRTYAATREDFWLTILQLQCINQISRRFFHPLSLPPQNYGRWSADMPRHRRW